jgi:hypothetical protein
MQPTALLARPPRQVRTAAAGAAATVLVIGAAVAWPMLASWLALALAIPALAMAYLALIKARMLEFCPEVLGGDVILPRNQRPQDGVRLLLPLQFTNAGYADGIIEWIAVRVTVDGRTDGSLLLGPVAEVDMQRFIQAKRQLEENTIEPFTRFALEGRRSLAKFVLFDHAEKRRRGEPLQLRPGRYSFELFIKATNSRQPKLERTFEHVLEQKHIEDYSAGSTVYLINYDISLHSVRRSLAGAEWLPRAQAN